jgi:hypothetical protein
VILQWHRPKHVYIRTTETYYIHKKTNIQFQNFPLKEQPDGQQQQGPLTGNILPDMDDSSDDI